MRRLLIVTINFVMSTNVGAVSISGQGTWESTLQGRDLDGNTNTIEAYYDTELDITWLADTNAIYVWAAAKIWVASLDFGLGIDNWRLPDISPIDGSSYDFTEQYDGTTDRGYNISATGTAYSGSTRSELAHMYYNTLGNLAKFDTAGNTQLGSGLTNAGPFNLQANAYWSGVKQPGFNLDNTISFNFNTGDQILLYNQNGYYSWAVHDGDVGAAVVPIPSAIWLFGSGLIGVIGLSRRKGNA